MGGSTLSLLFIILIVNQIASATNPSSEGLSYNFYDKTCPHVGDIVRAALASVFASDPTSPAALLRLMFHDCQVQGCDGSILIESLPSKPLEMSASKNFGIRKREAINLIKSMIEVECPGQVSCADILVLAAREAVAISGGPSIQVPLGRRDSPFAASSESADASLPSADIGVDDTLGLFAKLGMTAEEAVAILGAHTLGITHCLNVVDRLYKSYGERAGEINPKFEALLKVTCPQWIALTHNTSFVFNDPSTFHFDNLYFKNAMAGQGVLRIDAELPLHPKTASIVQQFGADQDHFFQAFGSAFVKLSRAGVLTGTQAKMYTVPSEKGWQGLLT